MSLLTQHPNALTTRLLQWTPSQRILTFVWITSKSQPGQWDFSNSKAWVNCELKALLHYKKRAFLQGDEDRVKEVQRQLKVKLRKTKDTYRRKLENHLQQNNMKHVCSGMKKITGFKNQFDGNLQRANELNNFNRFSAGGALNTLTLNVTKTKVAEHQH